jgi:hypothetical protein
MAETFLEMAVSLGADESMRETGVCPSWLVMHAHPIPNVE